MSLDSTVAGPSAVSYASTQEADAYFNSHWSTAMADAWKALRLPQKETLLASSTRVLETLPVLDREVGVEVTPMGYYVPIQLVNQVTLPLTARDFAAGIVVTRFAAEQALQFPRNIDRIEDGTAFIPQAVKEALFLQAVYLIKFDDSALVAQMQGILKESFQAGEVKGFTEYTAMGTMLAPHAYTLMKQFVRRNTSRRLHRA